ncbi:MAG: hypothetical protein IJG68_01825 [Bacilli bacterium]|nr:hypothetical protein [Bacilli bacterium]
MVTSLYTADVKLNKTDKDYHKYLMVYNHTEGILLINRGLFSISFDNEDALASSGAEIINKRHIGDINL